MPIDFVSLSGYLPESLTDTDSRGHVAVIMKFAVSHQLCEFVQKRVTAIPPDSIPEEVTRCVGTTVAAFLSSERFPRSSWFRDQRVHELRVPLVIAGHKCGTALLYLNRARRPVRARYYRVGTAPQEPLPLDYHTRRTEEERRLGLA